MKEIKCNLPSDAESEKWFIENIGIDENCSASSAIYKFRLWLNDRKCHINSDYLNAMCIMLALHDYDPEEFQYRIDERIHLNPKGQELLKKIRYNLEKLTGEEGK